MGFIQMWATVVPGSGKTVASVRQNFDTDKIGWTTLASQPGNAAFSQFQYEMVNGNSALARVKATVAAINAAVPTAAGATGFASIA